MRSDVGVRITIRLATDQAEWKHMIYAHVLIFHKIGRINYQLRMRAVRSGGLGGKQKLKNSATIMDFMQIKTALMFYTGESPPCRILNRGQ